MIKFEEIERIPSSTLSELREEYDYDYYKIDALKEIIAFHLSALNKLLTENALSTLNLEDIEVFSNDHECNDKGLLYNHRPHLLSCMVKCKYFQFNLEEQFNNCGILVSTNTMVYYSNRGIGTFLHAIKEDIARFAEYSYMMYTDKVYDEPSKNEKLLLKIGANEIFRGYNSRSGNNIAIWMKKINL